MIDPTETWMIRSQQQVFRVSNFKVTDLDISSVQYSSALPKSLVASRSFVGITMLDDDLSNLIQDDRSKHQPPFVFLTSEVPIDVQRDVSRPDLLMVMTI